MPDPIPAELLADELDRLLLVEPFHNIPVESVTYLLSKATMSFHRHGAIVIHPGVQEPKRRTWIVRKGSVRCADQAGIAAGCAEEKGPGAIFPIECVLDKALPRHAYIAADDCFLWCLEAELLEEFLHWPGVENWLAKYWQSEATRAQRLLLEASHARQAADQALALPVISAGSRNMVAVDASTSISDAAKLMSTRGIGSLLVKSGDETIGIVTQTDMVRRGLAKNLAGNSPLADIMTPRPASIEDHATILEAGAEMARVGFRHLLLHNSEGQISGLISERDLFRAQQQGIVSIFQPISDAASVDQLIAVAERARQLTERVFRNGMEVTQFTRLVSSINDRITQRLLTLVLGDTVEQERCCWLAFGSEGREEQGFVTDQDNGIIFVSEETDIEAERSRYLALARRANDALDACGFARCKGNIMAGNPEWCLSLGEWQDKFSRWIASTTPNALLNATIFFDFRPVYGNTELAEKLRDHLIEAVKDKSIFLHLMAKNALEATPPIGRLNRFLTDSGDHRKTLDLKTRGSRLFVDVARIYALATGVRATNTEQRLRIAGQRIRRTATAIEGDTAAFRFVQQARLRRQLESIEDGRAANRVDPYLLNEVEQRVLRESFRQAAALQERLRLDYFR